MPPRSADLRATQAYPAHGARVSMVWVRALLEAVEVAGISEATFMRVTGLSPAQVATPYSWVDVDEFDRLIGYALEVTGDPAFGLHWVERSPMMRFDLIAMTTAHSPSLRDALTFILQFQPALCQPPLLEAVERTDSLLLRLVPRGTTEPGIRVRAELVSSGLARLYRHMGAFDAAVRRVTFAYQAPAYADEYVRVFEGRVSFNQSHSGLEVASVPGDRRRDHVNSDLHQVLSVQAHRVLAQAQNSAGHAGRLREYLRSMYPQLPEMRDAARAMAMSVRSLRRRLADEGCSYTGVLQESQLQLTRQLLADPTCSIKEIAYSVGFANTAAFHRAFKRWTGSSPAAFRRTCISSDTRTQQSDRDRRSRRPNAPA